MSTHWPYLLYRAISHLKYFNGHYCLKPDNALVEDYVKSWTRPTLALLTEVSHKITV